MTGTIFTFLLLTSATFTLAQLDPNFAPGRHIIVHLFEWKWTDIEQECIRFLGPNGFGGVQVSPPNENLIWFDGTKSRPWWERYQPVSYNLTTRSGTEAQFRQMVATCNDLGVRIYADVVINHMTGRFSGYGTAGSYFDTDSLTFDGVPYSYLDFNGPSGNCPTASGNIEDYGNRIQVRNCRLSNPEDSVALVDLNQGNSYVQDRIVEYLNNLTAIGVAGIRIDASKHMWPEDMELILSRLNNLPTSQGWFQPNSKPFIFQEVIDLGGEPIAGTDYIHLGRVTEFKFGAFLGQVFRKKDGRSLKDLQHYQSAWGGLLESGFAFNFVDNHDNQRGHGAGGENVLTFRADRIYKQSIAFTLAIPYGVSRIMSSYFWPQYCANGPCPGQPGCCIGGKDTNDWIGPPHDVDYNTLDVIINEEGTCENGWICEHRWREIFQMVKFRNVVEWTGLNDWWDNGRDQIAFSRDDKGFIAINNDFEDLNASIQTGLESGFYCDVISGGINNNGTACVDKLVIVNENRVAQIFISKVEGSPIIAIHSESKLSR